MGVCTLKGYALLGKRMSIKRLTISDIFMVIMVYLSIMILFGIAVAEVYEVDILTGTSVVYFYLALVVTIFVVISANLYFNSIHNLKVAKNTFSTLAVTKLSGGKKWLQQGLDLL